MATNAAECELQLVNERRLARVLTVSPALLRRWRRIGGGPPWLRIGKRLVRYDVAELRKWITERAGVRERR